MTPLRGLLAAAVAFVCLAGETQAGCYDATGCVETAKSAEAFTQSVGINTHLGYSNTVYWQQWPMIRDRLKELGVSHIRDGTLAANYPDAIGPTVAARYRELDAAGIKGNLLVGHEQDHGSTTLAQRLEWIKSNSLAPFVIGIEGTNEHYIGVDHKDDWNHDAAAIDSLRQMQCDIYQRVHNDPDLAGKPVIGPSGGQPFYEDYWFFHVAYNRGDLTACMDRGNLHPYPGDDPPHLHQGRPLDYASAWSDHIDKSEPEWITESGYWNAGNELAVSEKAAGIYMPRLFLEAFRRGYERTQAYELIDLNTASDQVIDRYGLLTTDGSRKPAFTAVANTLAILRDTGSASGSFGFGIVCTSNCHSPIRHVLLRHSSGAYYLAAWSESRAWDKAAETDTPQPAQDIDLNLSEAPRRVDIYNTSGTAPFRTVTDGSKTIATQVTDGVRLFKVTPVARAGKR